MTGNPPAGRLHGVDRCVEGSGSLPHSHLSSSPLCRWPEHSWMDSLHPAHTPCTACLEGIPPLHNNMISTQWHWSKTVCKQEFFYKVSLGLLIKLNIIKLIKYTTATDTVQEPGTYRGRPGCCTSCSGDWGRCRVESCRDESGTAALHHN